VANKLYVGNLSYRTEQESLRSLFAQFGEVVSATVLTDRDTGRSRGFGFVEMADQEAANAAIQGLNGTEFEGRMLKVNEARERSDRDSDRRY
jgi:RNA recognition motif-containing protein